MRSGSRLRLVVLALLLAGWPARLAGQAKSPAYFGVQPGATGRAQVDLLLGEPLRRPQPDQPIYEYAPAKGDNDSSKIVVQFDADTQLVARLDAHLKAPVAAGLLRERFGTLMLSRDRTDGGREEFFFPQLFGIIFGGRAPDAPATAVSYLSPRTVGSLYARRSAERLAAKALDDARIDAEKAVAIDPDGAEGYLANGHVLLAQRDEDEALVRYTAAASAKYGTTERYQAYLAMAQIYLERKNWPDKAGAAFQGAIAVAAPGDRVRTRLNYAKFLADQKKTEDAVLEYTRAADAEPDNIDLRLTAAEGIWAVQDYAHALPQYAILGRHADATPGFTFAALVHFRHAFCLGDAGRTADAAKEYQKVVGDPKVGASALNNLGVIAQRGGDLNGAIEYYTQAVNRDPTVMLHNDNLTRALLGAGRFDQAARQGLATWNLQPKNPELMFTLARCYGALRNKKETLRWVGGAIDAGFADRNRLIADPSFAFVQNDATFKALLLKVR